MAKDRLHLAATRSPNRLRPAEHDKRIRAFIKAAMSFRHQRYAWGGGHGGPMVKPGPVDCTGLVLQAAMKAGLLTPEEARRGINAVLDKCQTVWHRGQSPSRLKPGDILDSGAHEAIYLGNGLMIDAPGRGRTIEVRPFIPSLFDTARRP